MKQQMNSQAFEKSHKNVCRSHGNYIRALEYEISRYLDDGEEIRVKRTCPLGLVWDMACSFAICFHSGNCMVDDISCSNSTDPCQPQVHIQPYCKVSFQQRLRHVPLYYLII